MERFCRDVSLARREHGSPNMPESTPLSTAPSTNESTQSGVLRVISTFKRIPLESVHPESTLDSLGIDSLDRLNILFDLESEFDIEINDEDAKKVTTIQQMVEGIDHLLAQKSAGPAATAAPAAGA